MLGISTEWDKVLTTTWSNKPAATEYIGYARITDIGVGGATLYSDGTAWRYENDITMSQASLIVHSMLAANASTYSKSGTTVTVTSLAHGLTADYNGASIYQLLDGAGEWLTNFTYISANSYSAVSATSGTATGTVNTNTAETTLTPTTATINGGLLGNSGALRLFGNLLLSAAASNTVIRAYLGGTKYIDASSTAQFSSIQQHVLIDKIIQNINSNRQVSVETSTVNSYFFDIGQGSVILNNAFYNIDTSVNNALTVSLQCTAANDFIAVSGLRVIVLK